MDIEAERKKFEAWAGSKMQGSQTFNKRDWGSGLMYEDYCVRMMFAAWQAAVARCDDWISIKDRLPKQDEPVLYCCWIDDHFTDTRCGSWDGGYTIGKTLVMVQDGYDPSWYPCSHWMPLPDATSEDLETNSDIKITLNLDDDND